MRVCAAGAQRDETQAAKQLARLRETKDADEQADAVAALRDLLQSSERVCPTQQSVTRPLKHLLPLSCGCLQVRHTSGAEALPVICSLLQGHTEDVDLVRAALECLLATLGPPPTAASGQQVLLSLVYISMCSPMLDTCKPSTRCLS